MSQATIPAVQVGRSYLSDPETEDCIWGDELREGMVIIAADDCCRSALTSSERQMETNRWCRVTKLRRSGTLVRFIGVYADGSQAPRSYGESWAWYVKRDSMKAE